MKFVVLALLLSVAFVAADEDPNRGETFMAPSKLGNSAFGETVLTPSADQNPVNGACACGFSAPNVCNPCGGVRARSCACGFSAPDVCNPCGVGRREGNAPAKIVNGTLVSAGGKTLKPVKVEHYAARGPCCCSCNNCAGCVVATTCGCQTEYVAPEIREVATCGCCGQASCGCCSRQVINPCGCCGQATCGCCTTMIKPELRDVHVQPELKAHCPCYFTRVEPCPCAASFRELPANAAVVDGVKL